MNQVNQRRRLLLGAAGAAASVAVPAWSWAQAADAAPRWPTRNVKIVAPYPAGGSVDTVCRKIAEMMAPRIGVPVLVQNSSGAAGMIGTRQIAAAAPDGGTFGYVHSGIAAQQAMGANIDLLREFTPVAPRMQAASFLFLVRPESPYKRFQDLLAAIKADPTKLTYGSGGSGSPEHILFEKLKVAVPGIGAVHVPFKGSIEGMTAVIGGQIDFMIAVTSSALGFVKGGRAIALANPGPHRSKALPDVPTVAESGVPGYSHVSWGGMFGPANMPPALAEKANQVFTDIARAPEFKAFLLSTGADDPPEESPEQFRAFLARSLKEDAVLMQKLGLKV